MKLYMNLIKRNNGIYYIVWRENGRQKWKSLRTRDKSIARRLYNQFKKAYLAGRIIKLDDTGNITMKQYAQEYFDWLSMTREAGTYEQYRIAWEKLFAITGNILLKDLTRRHIDLFVQDQQRKGNKPVTINKDLRSLKAILYKAVEWGYLRENPLSKYRMLPVDQKPPRALSADEIIRLLTAIDDPMFRLFVAFALYSGARRNEILFLTWDKVDLTRRVIFIEKTKSHKSRYIPISSSLMAVLQQLRQYTQVGRIFPEWSPNKVTKKFKKYARKAGLECRLHDLRHTFATHLISEGVPVQVLKDLLGHSNITTTMIYTHALEEYKRQAVEKLTTGLELFKG